MNSEKIEICGPGFRYFAHIGSGLVSQTGTLTRELVGGERAAIITDSNIPLTIVNAVAGSLASADFQVSKIVVPAGENAKSLIEVERICDELASLDRSSVLVGVGGGVVGDLSGFVAAILRRGIAHVQIPTTLLAMVDSSIGGKTGVNLAAGKNLIGAFHQPSLVIADVDALKTLPPREQRQGYAEMVKHAIIRDRGLFDALRDSPEATATADLIARNVRIKAAIIAADPSDTSGARALLNFGHTMGHGIECASGFSLPHGECVSLGIVAACAISVKRAGLTSSECERVIALLEWLGLPTQLQAGIDRRKILEAVARDKKFEGDLVRFVVTPRLGDACLSWDVTMRDIEEAIARL